MRYWIVFFAVLFSPLVLAANSCGDSNRVCTIDSNISVDQNWVDGNTYVILADVNVTGAGTDLNIAPGTVVKDGVGRSLIARDGVRILANGTVDKNIIFTSCRDQNSYAGSANVNTATVSGCSGAPDSSDYNTAIWVRSNAGYSKSDSFSFLKVFDENTGIRLDQNLGSVHDSNFMVIGQSGILVSLSSDVNLFNNSFQNISGPGGANGILILASFSGEIHDSRFAGIVNPSNGIQINVSPAVGGQIFFNQFFDFNGTAILFTAGNGRYIQDNNFWHVLPNGTAIRTVGAAGAVSNNRFWDFNTATAISLGGSSSGGIAYNRFSDFKAASTAILHNGAVTTGDFSWNLYHDFNNSIGINNTGTTLFYLAIGVTFASFHSTSIAIKNTSGTLMDFSYHTLFANINTAYNGTISQTPAYPNAYYNVTTPGATPAFHAKDINAQTGFTPDPFIADNSDRNFLLNTNPTGGAKLVDAGTIAIPGGCLTRTTQLNNKLDCNIYDIGYSYDQNGPYVQVLSPNDFNTLTGVQTIDFNVESAYDSVSVITAALAYSLIGSGNGTAIVSQSLSSYSCSQGPVFRCSYSWNTTAVLDGNYFIRLAGTDLNGTGVDYSDVNFAISNDSTAPVTTVDYNNAWQNVDANVVLTCVDASGCSLTQFRLDSDSSDVVLMGGWQTFDSNLLISSDGNWGIDFNSTDLVGNRETTNRVYVRIDKSLPSVKTVGLSATLSFLGSSESGIKKYWISSDGGTTYSDNGTTETYSFSISSAVSLPHTRRVYIKAMNNADINTAAQSVDVLFEPAGGGSTSVSCGNNICEVDENASVCPLDCPNVCGDRACTHTENNFSCPFDCAIGDRKSV